MREKLLPCIYSKLGTEVIASQTATLTLTIPLRPQYYNYSHFRDDETKGQIITKGRKKKPKVSEVVAEKIY